MIEKTEKAPSAAEAAQDPAEGSREVIDRELARTEQERQRNGKTADGGRSTQRPAPAKPPEEKAAGRRD